MKFHGSLVWDGGRVRSIDDFSYNVNPLGTPDFVESLIRKAVEAGVHRLYPPNDYTYLEERLKDYLGLRRAKVTVANGVSEIISRLPPCYVPEPNYSEYPRKASYDADFDGKTWRYRLQGECVVTSNPVNPTGTCIERKEVLEYLSSGRLLVLDESFVELSSCESFVDLVEEFENLVVLRSFTKSLALPGLRFGYAVHTREWLFLEGLPPWRVNSIAYYVFANLDYQKVGSFLEISRKTIEELRGKMLSLFPSYRSYAPYIIIRLKKDSEDVNRRLTQLGYYLRDHRGFKNFPRTWARVAVRRGFENLYEVLVSEGFI